MPSGKLGTALLNAGINTRVYTVPANRTASTNITIRNQTNNTALVSLVATDVPLPTTEYSAEISVLGVGDWFNNTFQAGNYGYGIFGGNSLNTNLYRAVGTDNIPVWVSPTDLSSTTSFSYTNTVTGDSNSQTPLLVAGQGNGMNSRYQISGFYNDDDYWFAGTSQRLATPNAHPLSKPVWTTSDMQGSTTASRSYTNRGGIGFRQVFLSVDNQGYVTKTIGRTNFTTEEITTSSSNSFYFLHAGNYGWSNSNQNLSVLPTTRLGQGTNNQFHFVYSANSGSTIGIGTHLYSRVVQSGSWGSNHGGSSIIWQTNWNSSAGGALWFRPVGNFVYGMSSNSRVYRRPIDGWFNNTTNWDDVTSQFGASTMSLSWPIVEDRNGIGYWFDTSGNLWHTNFAGDTWSIANQTNRAFLASFITTGLPTVGANFRYAPVGNFITVPLRSWMVMESGVAGYSRNFSFMDQSLQSAPGDLLESFVAMQPGAVLSNTGIILAQNSSIIAHSNTAGIRVQVFGYEE